ncbi:MAG: GntR family transcriptional regulator [Clostridiaceae bacterium]|nr:GntR family transcriptional regulator [Clostridiaceae bacterium]
MSSYSVASPYNTETIYQDLREGILSLKYKPGQLLSENAIAAAYQVSRSPIRAVFSRLANENLLMILPQKGSYVTLIDYDFIREIIYMRTLVERDILKQAAASCDDKLIKNLESNLRKQHRLADLGSRADHERYYQIDNEFHQICFRHVGRDLLWQILQEHQVHYRRFRMLDILSQQILSKLVDEHELIAQVISSGDTNKLDQLIEEHLVNGLHRIEQLVMTEHPDYFYSSNSN